ncbi:hypothetical protein OIU74_000925 [Salix koriyanagi]|uniref:Uncharacterized protein n=1 Tax=Salix koriyanagi TaxID=2511006 RepID=A0A9Q1AMY0_9ROSI|nr:hypothetical protein OIU74_000925 [Salix koriyanagi]
MTSRRQREQSDHHIEYYPYPSTVFNDEIYPITDDIDPVADESFVDVAASLDTESTHQTGFDCDTHVGFHYKDPSAIASSSSAPSLISKSYQIERADITTPLSSNNLSSLVSNYQTEDQPINVPSIIPDQYNIIGQSFYQKKRKRELSQNP